MGKEMNGRKVLLSAVLIVSMLSACGRTKVADADAQAPRVSKGTIEASDIGLAETPAQGEEAGSTAGAYTLPQKTGYEAPTSTENRTIVRSSRVDLEKARSSIGITETELKKRMREQAGNYFFDLMEADQQLLYTEILMVLEKHGENILISAKDADTLKKVFLCVFQDHPEIYWIDGYGYSRYGSGDNCYFTFSGKYTYSKEQCDAYQPMIDAFVSKCESGLPQGARDYEKVKYVYEYIIQKTDYDLTARDNQNILSVFLYGESVCQGYAKAVQYLLKGMNVPCTMVVGKVNNGEGHAWNLVNVDGSYYYVDATWGDAGYISNADEGDTLPNGVSYHFLNVTTEEMNHTHTLDNVMPMPYCIATDANYYVREGDYVIGYQPSKLQKLFEEAMSAGEKYVSFKCSSEAVYNLCVTKLLEKQEVFDYLPAGAKSVDYFTDEDLYIISFWF
ncbi:MAG: hypothetical protein IKQ27_08620 [Lachnospiraceae bacterium]|nr:hypothetical protein [Lachnospiraceae bacterium]